MKRLLVALLLAAAPVAHAQKVHLLIITGLAGEPQYGTAFRAEAALLADSARKRWGVADSSLIVLGEDPAADPKHITGHSTREEVARAFLQLTKRVVAGDVVLVFLNGHGAGEGVASRVNLPGPDPTAGDFATWIAGFTAQTVVFVNAASGSGDFTGVLAGRGRVIVTATRTALERNEVQFARPFVVGLTGAADTDKDDRVSVLEAVDYAKKEIARLYDADKRMLTEHAVVTDTALARSVTFGAPRAAADPRVLALIAERQQLEAQVAALRGRKATTDSTTYSAELERLLLLMAEKSQAIRTAGGKP
ncbi:MAG: hypothetical protein JWM95_4679 [Gemmatimonadetes bacterium]|nr:hypothetical protein [Gemmatimonadota bacterium]